MSRISAGADSVYEPSDIEVLAVQIYNLPEPNWRFLKSKVFQYVSSIGRLDTPEIKRVVPTLRKVFSDTRDEPLAWRNRIVITRELFRLWWRLAATGKQRGQARIGDARVSVQEQEEDPLPDLVCEQIAVNAFNRMTEDERRGFRNKSDYAYRLERYKPENRDRIEFLLMGLCELRSLRLGEATLDSLKRVYGHRDYLRNFERDRAAKEDIAAAFSPLAEHVDSRWIHYTAEYIYHRFFKKPRDGLLSLRAIDRAHSSHVYDELEVLMSGSRGVPPDAWRAFLAAAAEAEHMGRLIFAE